MKQDELADIGIKLFGAKWQAPLGRLLRLNHSTIWRWAKGHAPIPAHTGMLLSLFLDNPELVKRLDSREWHKMVDTARTRAMLAVKIAVRQGYILKRPCEVCGVIGTDGRSGVQAHHDDYNRPIDVRWLCRKHHRAWHVDNHPIDMASDLMRLLPTELVELGAKQLGFEVSPHKLKRWKTWRATDAAKK